VIILADRRAVSSMKRWALRSSGIESRLALDVVDMEVADASPAMQWMVGEVS